MAKTYRIAWLPGDGIGPEVTQVALDILDRIADQSGFKVQVQRELMGGEAIDETGSPFPDATREVCLEADAVLLGAVGGPKWDDLEGDRRPESGLLELRKALGAYANLRPVVVADSLVGGSPLKTDRVTGTDLLIVRELTGGVYFGEPSGRRRENGQEVAYSTMVYSEEEVARIARIAFQWAQRRSGQVVSVDKANVLEVSRLWREVVEDVHEAEYSGVDLEHLYVDNAAMQLVLRPSEYDVVLTGNLFGDILSDLAATFPGSLGMLPSASLGGSVGLFEPVHGSAPDIAGQDVANPLAAILSVAMMLDYWDRSTAADILREAVDQVLDEGFRTVDIWSEGQQKVSTEKMARHIMSKVSEELAKVSA